MRGPRRSWWGWGYEDAAVAGEELDALAGRVRALMPLDGELSPIPPIDSLVLPEPRIQPGPTVAHLCTVDRGERVRHTYGKAYRDVVRALRGEFAAAPDLVGLPRTEEDVAALLSWAGETGVAVIPFGGGTSVVGGVECRDRSRPVLSLDLRLLSGVVEVDPTNLLARVRGGTLGPSIADGLRPYSLSLRHYPQSYEFSTMGGWVATRAGGHYATGLTHIDDMVQALRVVTPVGVATSARVPASGAGPSPDRLWLGSEGALGVISEAWVRVQRTPTRVARSSVRFAEYADAVTATREIVQSGLRPANCRLLDPVEALIGASVTDGTSRLLLAFESAGLDVEPELRSALAICAQHGGTPEDSASPGDAGREWTGNATSFGSNRSTFIRAPYLRDALIRLGVVVETFETACSWTACDQLRAAVTDAVGAAGGIVSSRFTHVYPDGPAPYFTVYVPARRGAEVEQWDAIKAAVSDVLTGHGATITHHHAVGRDHRPWYDRERPEPFALALRAAKAVLDPAGILNPGVLV
jgi:alkyldihydroxyacetonephosphate synthase